MFRSLEADAAPNVDAFLDWRVVVRAYGNHHQQSRPSMTRDPAPDPALIRRAVMRLSSSGPSRSQEIVGHNHHIQLALSKGQFFDTWKNRRTASYCATGLRCKLIYVLVLVIH